MNNHCLLVVEQEIDNHTRDHLADELSVTLAGSRLDPDRDTVILSDIGAHALRAWFSGRLLAAVRNYRTASQLALSVRNLPFQDVLPTPVDGFTEEVQLAATNAIHLGLIRLAGLTPFAVSYENRGRLMRNVVPNPVAAGTTSSWGADTEFSWHTDNPHQAFGRRGMDPRLFPPRYLTFMAVRNVERVPTSLTTVDRVLAALPPDTLRTLESGLFQVGAPDSNDTDEAGGRICYTGVPIIEPAGVGGHYVRFDRGTTRALTAEADAALRVWTDTLDRAEPIDVVLQPGEFLIFDNYRLLHRRLAFTPAGRSQARWLRRCYAS